MSKLHETARRGFSGQRRDVCVWWWHVAVVVALVTLVAQERTSADHRKSGYLYLSPRPGAEYTSRGTKFILVRFDKIPPTAVTNLENFITITGERSGPRTGTTKVAGDQRTIVFELSGVFHSHERVTVSLTPEVAAEFSGRVEHFVYHFMTCGRMPDPPKITATGEVPEIGSATHAFDFDPRTEWMAPFSTAGTNGTWIQFVYPSNFSRVLGSYSIRSATAPEDHDPADWRLYGVDHLDQIVLLDVQTSQHFDARGAKRAYAIENRLTFRGYRLEVTHVKDPEVDSVRVAELEFQERSGGLLWECWTSIPGRSVSDLTNHTRYPDEPDLREYLTSFEAPTEWTNNYGTRVRGLVTAPATGEYTFWISSDDTSELWLGTNRDPASRRRIAFVSEWNHPREWLKLFMQKSAAIPLLAGQDYYIEALQKENLSNDNLAVAWAKPGEGSAAPSEVIPGAVLTPWPEAPKSPATSDGIRLMTSTATPKQVAPRSTTKDTAARYGDGKGHGYRKAVKVMPNGVSVPSDFPQAIITVNRSPAPGYLFLEGGAAGSKYTMMLDNTGAPVWYRRGQGRDFRLQQNSTITWGAPFEGTTTPYTGVDKSFEWVRDYVAVNGFWTDEHELRVLSNGGYLLIGAHGEFADLSSYFPGAWNKVFVYQTVIQEFTAAGELILQFCPWDHFDVAAVDPRIEPRGFSMRFPHLNAIEVDSDGHLLSSSRHLNEVTKIDRDTGEVIWRLGGIHSDFTFVGDPLNGFSAQHDVSVVGTNRYLLFDNGNTHQPPVSRAVEYELNLANKTATLVWQFRDSPDRYTHFMGNAQRLPNSNTLINFVLGSYPKAVEVDRAGVKQFELNLTPSSDLYRVFRFPWDGEVTAPYLLVEPQVDNVSLLFNQFGHQAVDHYRIYAGLSPHPTNLVATSKATVYSLKDVTNDVRNYFRVTALSTNGLESAWSNEESLVVNIVKPGENIVKNNDFTQGQSGWTLTLSGVASAQWQVSEGTAQIQVSSPGSYPDEIQLSQAGFHLAEGRKYVMEFDAWATQPRVLEVNVVQSATPGANYSQNPPVVVTPVRTRFRYSFLMRSPSDTNARLVFNAGTSPISFHLDNVSLMLSPSPDTDLNADGNVDYLDLRMFTGEWLGSGANLSSDLNGDGKVDFEDFALFAKDWTAEQGASAGGRR